MKGEYPLEEYWDNSKVYGNLLLFVAESSSCFLAEYFYMIHADTMTGVVHVWDEVAERKDP